MHYDAKKGDHGLRRDPYKSIVAPRPVGWISTVSKAGICNLAPYSFFNAIGDDPPMVMFSSEGVKDSVKNIEETGEFVCSLATFDLRHALNTTSAPVPYGVDEFPLAGLTAAPSKLVKPPRVKESPAALECRHWQTITLPQGKSGVHWTVVIGEVVGIFIDDAMIRNGRVATADLVPIARLGGADYAVVKPEVVFPLGRPTVDAEGKIVVKG